LLNGILPSSADRLAAGTLDSMVVRRIFVGKGPEWYNAPESLTGLDLACASIARVVRLCSRTAIEMEVGFASNHTIQDPQRGKEGDR
jgi:hypothetical protein